MSAPNAVRITGGDLKGRNVPVPRTARPTEGRVREALFSRWREHLSSARFLDLFAGSGVVALEAVSRGAREAVAVEKDPVAFKLLEDSLRKLGQGAARPWRASLPGGLPDLARHQPPFDLIYADPPYSFTAHNKLLAAACSLLTADGELALEHSARLAVPEEVGELRRVDQRRYGESQLSFYRRVSPPDEESQLFQGDTQVDVF